jgi:hypothetical protein
MVPEIASKKRESEPILLRFGKATIHLLIYAKRLYIPTHEGLRLIGVEPNWLNVGKKSRRERLLKRQKFSFEEILLCYQIGNSEQYVFVEAYSYEDWLIVWGYFASKGNSRAISVLRWLAQFGVEQHMKTLGQ